ncbi:MAG: hypothetical protein Q6363_006865, partial [Candidatus Njordarchaeota archaeon]
MGHRNIDLIKGKIIGSYGLAVYTEYKKKKYQYSFNFYSLGGGVINMDGAVLHKLMERGHVESVPDFYRNLEKVPDREDLEEDIRDLFGSEVPIWVYFDTSTLMKLRAYHNFFGALDKNSMIYSNLENVANILVREYRELETNMFGEIIYRFE